MTTRLKQVLSDASLLYVAAIWGSTFIVVKDSLRNIDPIVMVGYRFLLAALFLLIFLIIKKKVFWKNLIPGIVLGILLWLIYIPQTVGLLYTTAANSVFITGLFVAFVPIFSLVIYRKLPALPRLLAVGMSVLGLWFLTGGLQQINKGDSLTIVTSVAYALYLLASDKFVHQKLDPYVLAFQEFLFVGLLSFIVAFVFKLPLGFGTVNTLGIVLFLTLFPSLSAFVIQLNAQKYTSPIKTSIIFATEPLIGAIFAWTLGGEKMIASQLIGGGLICLSMVLSELPLTLFTKLLPRPKETLRD